METQPDLSADTAADATAAAATTPVSRVRWWIHLAVLSGYLLLMAVVGFLRYPSDTPALSSSASRLLLVCTFELMLFGVVWASAWLASRASHDQLLLRWHGRLRPLLLGAGYSVLLRLSLAVVALSIAALLLVTRLATVESVRGFAATHQPNVQAVVDVSAMRDNPAYYLLTLTFVSFVVAGLREELWRAAFLAGLRSLWPRRFGSRSGAVAAVAIAAVVFGLGHVAMGPVAVCLTALLGFGLGLIMVLHRSIWPAVLAHGFFDATSLALIPWAVEQLDRGPRLLG